MKKSYPSSKTSKSGNKSHFAARRARPGSDKERPAPYSKERKQSDFKSHRPAKNQTFKSKFSKPKAAPVAKIAPRQGVFIWGIHAAREAWLNPDRQCFNMWITESGKEALDKTFVQAHELRLSRPEPKTVERVELDGLLPPASVHQGVVLEVAPLPDVQLFELIQSESLPDVVVVLDQITDPHNVGAILRSAAAFGAGAVIMTERNAPSTTGVMAKTASGAAEHVMQVHVVNLSRSLTELQQAGYWCVGLAEEAARELSALDLSGRTAIVLGAEGDGLRRLTREHCDELARLPTGGPIASLNVSNAAAIALYEVKRQRSKFD
ncbi:MAG: 23S rRNA (guanosine(2251)-2'-O)-methyltransferase RlmB [Alphaproteobacteria bacterium]|nr:23S rRNA (guanosine(2251)-2'-O)-methyltransferase RlmB [Alphaproteobacteria bacterium]